MFRITLTHADVYLFALTPNNQMAPKKRASTRKKSVPKKRQAPKRKKSNETATKKGKKRKSEDIAKKNQLRVTPRMMKDVLVRRRRLKEGLFFRNLMTVIKKRSNRERKRRVQKL